MSIINKIKNKILKYRACKNDETKRKYLRSIGCKVGDKTRFKGLPHIGTEPYLVEIGEDCLFSSNVHFHTHDGGVKVLNSIGYFNGQRMDKMGRIYIGNNCFIGNDARIMMGVKIGNNCIVGAGSIVTRNVPDGCVVAGIPAKVICTIEEYYQKNLNRGRFFPTPQMSKRRKKEYLINNVPLL